MKKILFLGPKSPPVTGYANIVESLAHCLSKQGASVKYLSTVPCFLAQTFPGFSWKVLRLVYMFVFLPFIMLLMPFNSILYLNINGGFGQVFDALVVFVARILGKSIILQHNSYAYINRRSWLPQLLFFIAGKNARHVVNCEDMKKTLISQYKYVENVYFVSNVSILAMADPEYFGTSFNDNCKLVAGVDKNILTLGFMGYFNKEKGLDTFSSVINKADDYAKGFVKGAAVGPVHDEVLVEELKQKHNYLIEFRSPVFGEKRDAFFNEIDVLLFPSRYLNEAEPLTIHHALNAGVPVISTDIGCIKGIISQLPGCYCFSQDNYIQSSVQLIKQFSYQSIEERRALKMELKTSYHETSLENVEDFKIILDKLGLL